jgi:hypothetical protein
VDDNKEADEEGILETTCYGKVSTLGIINYSLDYNYGLLYPTIRDVFSAIRNGLSPGCRDYQLKHVIVPDETGVIRPYVLFERWLFWRDANGKFAPYYPPSAYEYLGKYGNHEFWTTSHDCLSDFIILGINATANSHAVAVNSAKIGPTPALSGQ